MRGTLLRNKLNEHIPVVGGLLPFTYRIVTRDRAPTCTTCEGSGFSPSGFKNYYLECIPCSGTALAAIPWSELFKIGRV